MAIAPAAYAEMKIVVLDPVRAILESDEGQTCRSSKQRNGTGAGRAGAKAEQMATNKAAKGR